VRKQTIHSVIHSKHFIETKCFLENILKVVLFTVFFPCLVADFMEGRVGEQCMHRYMKACVPEKKGKWSEDENEVSVIAFSYSSTIVTKNHTKQH